MEKQTVVHPYNGKPLGSKREEAQVHATKG